MPTFPQSLATGALCAVGASVLHSPTTLAQESIFTPGATQPAVGNYTLRTQFRFTSYSGLPEDRADSLSELSVTNILSLAFTPTLSMDVGIPAIVRHTNSSLAEVDGTDTGFGDLSVGLKWRFWQEDPGPVDTRRLAVFTNLETPTGADPFTSDSWDPTVGLVYMMISGRHGFNQSVSWKFTTGANAEPVGPGEGLSDLVRVDSAYLYRINPATYSEQLQAATYLTAELNGQFETNGDSELFFSPGILYEAPRFALEAGVQIPIWQEVNERAETKFSVILGVRILF